MEQAIALVSDVKNLSELLDGASVDQTRLVPIGGRLRLEIELTRACPELQTVVRRGFLTRTKTPWVKGCLTLNQVTDAAVRHVADASPGQAPLLTCEAIPGGYRLVVTAPDGLQLQLTLEQLNGQFADVGKPIESP